MAKIALIDDGVIVDYLNHNTKIKCWNLIHERKCMRTTVTNCLNHATMCALIIEKYASDFSLFSIQVMSQEEPRGEISHLVDALELCKGLDVDIISISIGSTKLSEHLLIGNIIDELVNNKIMVAASSNEEYLTIPAAYDKVIGVQTDKYKLLETNSFAYFESLLGTQFIVNYNLDLEVLDENHTQSNSYAVPVLVSHINDIMNNAIRDYDSVMKRLISKAKDSSIIQRIEAAKVIEAISAYRKTPTVGIVVNMDTLPATWCSDLLNYLSIIHGYEGIVLTNRKKNDDIRVRFLGNKSLTKSINYHCVHSRSDLVIAVMDNDVNSKHNVTNMLDLLVFFNRSRFEIYVDGELIDINVKGKELNPITVGDLIVDLFSKFA